MKKVLIIAIAVFMTVAFTQCSAGGSKEYNDTMSYLKKTEKAIKSAKNCDELDKASELFWQGVEDKDYAKEDQITEEENKKVLEYLEKVSSAYKELIEKFNCD